MSKKIKLMAFVFVAVLFCVVSSQAALIELGLPTTVNPGPGSLLIDVVLTDSQGVPDIDGFNLWIGASGTGAIGLTADPAGNTLPGYIFPSTFAYFVTPTSPLEVSVAGSTFDSGTTGLLAQLAFDYAGNLGDIYSFALVDPDQNFGSSASGPDFPLILTGNTMIEYLFPIPGAIWLLGSSLLVLMGIRRMKQ